MYKDVALNEDDNTVALKVEKTKVISSSLMENDKRS